MKKEILPVDTFLDMLLDPKISRVYERVIVEGFVLPDENRRWYDLMLDDYIKSMREKAQKAFNGNPGALKKLILYHFEGCIFNEVDLSGFYLPHCRFNNSSFYRSNLSNTVMESSEFNETRFTRTHLSGTSFKYSSGVIKTIGTNTSNADFSDSSLHVKVCQDGRE